MLSPQELYLQYTLNPCQDAQTQDAFGTPYDLPRLIRFMRHLKYPCVEGAPFVNVEPSVNPSGIKNTGAGKLGIPYKFLNRIDAEAFTETQLTIDGGTAHAIRNACDLTRACGIENTKTYSKWESRMATEYLYHFGTNSLPDCLMMLGPDLVTEEIAMTKQIPGCSYEENNQTYKFDCIKNPTYGAAGANFGCRVNAGETIPKCRSCEECDPEAPWTPCCQAKNCLEKLEKCCEAPQTNRYYFSYLQQNENSRLTLPIIIDLRLTMDIKLSLLKHVGIIKRKSYGGYGNFIDNSGSDFYACNDDMFLQYFQSKNNYNYTTDTVKTSADQGYIDDSSSIERCRTISLVAGANRMSILKDLLYNGYGVVLMTNVGFPNTRDSSGLSYPDRIWYHCFSIIGYDDSKIEYPECVYLIANSWGDWNSGGEPSWGPIPSGSFLVTESHLMGMTRFNHSPSFMGCRTTICPDNIAAAASSIGLNIDYSSILVSPDLPSLLVASGYTPSDALVFRLLNTINNRNDSGACSDPLIKARYGGCKSYPTGGDCCEETNSSCTPYYCTKYQTAFGLLFAISMEKGFPRRNFNYKQFYPINNYRKLDNTSELYLDE